MQKKRYNYAIGNNFNAQNYVRFLKRLDLLVRVDARLSLVLGFMPHKMKNDRGNVKREKRK